MFSEEELSQIKQNKSQFKNAMTGIALCAKDLSENERKDFLGFVISVIGQELAAGTVLDVFRHGEHGDVERQIPLSFEYLIKTEKDYDLSQANVVGVPTVYTSLVGAVQHINERGFCSDMATYQANFYPEINLAIVTNGHHHLSVAGIMRLATADVQIFSLHKASKALATDGGFWYLEEDGLSKSFIVQDYRIALMYALYLAATGKLDMGIYIRQRSTILPEQMV